MMSKSGKILAVDDEPKMLEVIRAFLVSRGYQVLTADSGCQALHVFDREDISLVLLDLMLPDISGEEICRTLRKKSRVPIIILTARIAENDLIQCLQTGADDYITKPFSLLELQARMETVLRRTTDELIPLAIKTTYRDGDLIVDYEHNVILKKGEPVNLTPSEMKLLSALLKYPGKVFTRSELIGIALGDGYDGYDRSIDAHIKNLRQKIEDDPRKPVYVLTMHGLGYKFGGW